jgi:2-dehydropantoate 2-reductase
MRIAIVGAGGVGGLLGGLLARAGEEIEVVARGEALAAIRRDGLRVESPLGKFAARVAAAAADPTALGAADAVLVAVKAWQVAEVAPRLASLAAPGAPVVPLQNGVEAADRLSRALGEERVAGGTISVLAWLQAPGSVKHVGGAPIVRLGERGARAAGPSARLDALAAALVRAGVVANVVEDVERATWEKFLLIEPWGAVASASRAPLGVHRAVPELRALHERAMDEVAALARARGVALPADAVARTLEVLDGIAPEATASMQRDLGAGRPSELEDQVGAVIRFGREAGVPVPAHETLYALLVAQERAVRDQIPRFPRT